MKATLESDVLKACLAYLEQVRRWPVWRINTASFGGYHNGKKRWVKTAPTGHPDLVGIIPIELRDDQGRLRHTKGRYLAVEVKRPGGKVRPEQRVFLDQVEAMGGLALLVHSVDELIDLLAEEGY